MKHSTADKHSNVWENVLGDIENKVGIRQYNLWFKNTRLISLNSKSVSIGVPNLFIQTKIRDHFEPLIKDSISNITKIKPSINFLVESGRILEKSCNKTAKDIKTEKSPNQNTDFVNNRQLLLENFIVVYCNILAYSSAL